MNINDKLTDEDLEECIDGSTDLDMIRSIINLTQKNNQIDVESFADTFAYRLSGFTEDDEEAEDNNWDWGYSIAENINELLQSK